MKPLVVGSKIAHFTAIDNFGNTFDSSEIIGKKILVVYFYPKDNTPGCTAQACSFRDQYEDFSLLGAEVIGVSSDAFDTHDAFARRYQLPFKLLADPDKKLRNLFGVPTTFFGLMPGRVTYIIDLNGTIVSVFNSSLQVAQHISKALTVVEKLVR